MEPRCRRRRRRRRVAHALPAVIRRLSSLPFAEFNTVLAVLSADCDTMVYAELVHILDYYFNQLLASARARRRRSRAARKSAVVDVRRKLAVDPLVLMRSSAVSSADSGFDDFPFIDVDDDMTTPIIVARPFDNYGRRKKPWGKLLRSILDVLALGSFENSLK